MRSLPVRRAHRGAFALTPEYLQATPRGIASAPWLYEYGLQTSRGFRALKVWMALKQHGVEKFGRLIDQNIAQGRYLSELIVSEQRQRCKEYIASGSRYAITGPVGTTWICWSGKSFDSETRFCVQFVAADSDCVGMLNAINGGAAPHLSVLNRKVDGTQRRAA
ncbi:pyridoxal-dependent decarboxylase [Paraburkholderia youngii]|uniref:pyridoxal-dependent decarboxylase n=1 Tax=Paraburkholderia youngii TaxID=2782701 RepID=UPI003D1E607C